MYWEVLMMFISNPENNWVFFVGAVVIMAALIVVPLLFKNSMKDE